MDRIYIISVPC